MDAAMSAQALAPLRVGQALEWLRLVDLSRLGGVVAALRELWALPRDFSDAGALRAWVVKALEVAVLAADATRVTSDDAAVAELRRLLTQSTVLDALVDLVGRVMARKDSTGDEQSTFAALSADTESILSAAGVPPAVTAWLVQFLLDLLGRWLARDEAT